jgi:hypothetical protein
MKNKNTKLALITFGAVVAVATPAIVIASIYAYNTNKMSTAEKQLISFFDKEEASLFEKNNFVISEPEVSLNGQYLVDNISTNNVTFSKQTELNNYSYNIEITKININSKEANLSFEYVVSLITDSTVKITKTSQVYSEYSSFDGYKPFDKLK